MSTEFILSCCTPADLSKEYCDQRNIHYICGHYYLDDQHYFDDFGQSMSLDGFYKAMVDGADTKTSQVNTDEFVNYFRPFLEQGKDILHVSLSSGLSGTYNSARIAVEMLGEEFPDRKILLVDSLGASSGYGLLVATLADLRDEGKSIEEIYAFANENNLKMHHWFFSTDLTFYVKGGRVSKASGWFGTMLKICPLLNMNYEGKLIPRFKIRGKEKVIEAIVEKMEEFADGRTDYHGRCFISYSACLEDAQKVKTLVESKFPHIKDQVELFPIGTTIGSHAGPGTVALFFWGDQRVD